MQDGAAEFLSIKQTHGQISQDGQLLAYLLFISCYLEALRQEDARVGFLDWRQMHPLIVSLPSSVYYKRPTHARRRCWLSRINQATTTPP